MDEMASEDKHEFEMAVALRNRQQRDRNNTNYVTSDTRTEQFFSKSGKQSNIENSMDLNEKK